MNVERFPKYADAIRETYTQVYEGRAVPSMRSMQFSMDGILRRNNRAFNCFSIALTSFKCFADLFYQSMSGGGVGYSVRSVHISQLPKISDGETLPPLTIADSAEGWADSVLALLENPILLFDYSQIRPIGAPLSTGGTASGPKALIKMHAHMRHLLKKCIGRKLTAFEVHRLCCFIADCVVVGGVRRCLPGNTRVATSEGLVRVDELRVGAEVFDKKGTPQQVLAWAPTGELPLVKVRHQLGEQLCTPEHRFMVFTDLDGSLKEKEAQHLTSEDYIAYNPQLLQAGKATQAYPAELCKKLSDDAQGKEITLPVFDADQAWLFGNLHGAGYVHMPTMGDGEDRPAYVSFAHSPAMPETNTKVMVQLRRFGVEPVVKKPRPGDACEQIVAASSALARFFLQFEPPAAGLEVPELVLRGDAGVRAAYLAGLFDAGSSATSKNRKVANPKIVATVHEALAQDVCALLGSLGIPAKVENVDKPHIPNWQSLYTVRAVDSTGLFRLKEHLDPFSERSRKGFVPVARKKEEQLAFVVPKKLMKGSATFKQAGNKRMNYSWYAFQEQAALDYSYLPIKVIDVVETDRVEYVYDIEVTGSHTFLINGGLVSHNSAMIALFDPEDTEMMHCKAGNWFDKYPELGRANNSAVIHKCDPNADEKASAVLQACFSGGQAEPGLMWTNSDDYIVNPCAEISILASGGACNLTEVNAAACFSQSDWLAAVRAAAVIGTLQASYTDFQYVQPQWRINAEKEALLGVSITGQAENQAILTPENLRLGAALAVETNIEWAAKLGINPAHRICTTKPSGSASSWLGTTPGIHAGHEICYLRRVRMEKDSKLARGLQRHFPAFMVQDPFTESDSIIQIPIRMSDNTLLRTHETALQLLDRMKQLYHNWIVPGHVSGPNTHNISMTVSYHHDEEAAIKKWMLDNKDSYYGISLIPYAGGDYKYLPYSAAPHPEVFEILEKSFNMAAQDFKFDYIKEVRDMTNLAGEAACTGGACVLE